MRTSQWVCNSGAARQARRRKNRVSCSFSNARFLTWTVWKRRSSAASPFRCTCDNFRRALVAADAVKLTARASPIRFKIQQDVTRHPNEPVGSYRPGRRTVCSSSMKRMKSGPCSVPDFPFTRPSKRFFFFRISSFTAAIYFAPRRRSALPPCRALPRARSFQTRFGTSASQTAWPEKPFRRVACP